MKSQSTALVRNISMAFTIQIVGYGITFALNVLLARWLGAAQYGSFIFFKNTITILSVFGTLGLFGAATKYLSAYLATDKISEMCGFVIVSTCITLMVSIILMQLATALIGRFSPLGSDSQLVLLFMPVLILLALHLLYGDMLRGMGYIVIALAPMDVLRPLLMLSFFAILSITASGSVLIFSLLAYALSLALVVLMQVVIALRRLLRERISEVRYHVREWLLFGFESLMVRGNIILRTEFTPIIIGYVLAGEAIGLFVVAERAAYLTAFLFNAVRRVFQPMIAPLYENGDMQKLNRLHIRITRWTFWGSLIVAVVMMFFADVLLGLFGTEFVAARPVLAILLFGQVINAATGQSGSILRFAGYEPVVRKIMLITTGTVLIVAVLLTHLFGIVGTAIAVSGAVIGQNIAFYQVMQRELGLRLPLSTYWIVGEVQSHA